MVGNDRLDASSIKNLPQAVTNVVGGWGGGSKLETIKSSGIIVAQGPQSLNFTGSGVASITNSGGTVTVDIQGGGGSSITWVSATPTGTFDGANATFTLPSTPDASSLQLFLNGQYMTPTSDYTLSGTTITFTTAPDAGLSGLPFSAKYTTSSSVWTSETPTGTFDGANATFTLSAIPTTNALHLFLNGQYMNEPLDYTLSGNTITFTTVPDVSLSGLPFSAKYM